MKRDLIIFITICVLALVVVLWCEVGFVGKTYVDPYQQQKSRTDAP